MSVQLSESTASKIAEVVTTHVGGGYDGSPTDHPVPLAELDGDLGSFLVQEAGDPGLVGTRVDPDVLQSPEPHVEPSDLSFFVIGTGNDGFAGSGPTGPTIPTPMATSGSANRPGSEGDLRLANAVSDLLDVIGAAGVQTDAARDAWSRCRFHDASEFPGGLPEGVEGATFLWKIGGSFPVAGFLNWLLIWWDEHHHVVLASEHVLHLKAGDFEDLGHLTPASQIVLRELARVVAAESGCVDEAEIERVVADLQRSLTGAFAMGTTRQAGGTPTTSDVLDYHLGLRDLLELGAEDCIPPLGLPYAGGATLDAPEAVPAGAPFQVHAHFEWPDGTPCANQYVVLIVEDQHHVVATDENGETSHAFTAPDAPGTVEARAAGLGRSAFQDVRVVAGDSGACCLPDRTCHVLFPEDCRNLDGTYLGDASVCEPDPCEDHGACCDESGQCTVLTLDECVQADSISSAPTSRAIRTPAHPTARVAYPDASVC
ncbi:MAG: hypothetical protein R3E12_00450 [Candidatus Eisenbacteria bacterium]